MGQPSKQWKSLFMRLRPCPFANVAPFADRTRKQYNLPSMGESVYRWCSYFPVWTARKPDTADAVRRTLRAVKRVARKATATSSSTTTPCRVRNNRRCVVYTYVWNVRVCEIVSTPIMIWMSLYICFVSTVFTHTLCYIFTSMPFSYTIVQSNASWTTTTTSADDSHGALSILNII